MAKKSVYVALHPGLEKVAKQYASSEGRSVSAVIQMALMAMFGVDDQGRPAEGDRPTPPRRPVVEKPTGPGPAHHRGSRAVTFSEEEL